MNNDKIQCYLCGNDAIELKPLGAYKKIRCESCNETYGITSALDSLIKKDSMSKEEFRKHFYLKKAHQEKFRDIILSTHDIDLNI